jgi:phospholipid N-methyltransferase
MENKIIMMKQLIHSQHESYDEMFAFFLAHTNEKEKCIAWLEQFISQLPKKQLCIDAGAGNGALTQVLCPHFNQFIAIEPNPDFQQQLQTNYPTITIKPDFILNADIMNEQADFIVCSHVFYYIPQNQWLVHIEKLASWLIKGGSLILILQYHLSDCMQMHSHFMQHSFNFVDFVPLIKTHLGHQYHIESEVLAADITTFNLAATQRIAEFMLKLLPNAQLPSDTLLTEYIQQNFSKNEQGHRFSTDQIFIKIRSL